VPSLKSTKRQVHAAAAAALVASIQQPRVEITRSFTYKLNVGNYESRDFFCAQKAECSLDEAEAVAARIHAFCKAQVMIAVREYEAEAKAAFGGQRRAG
jgi:hypothetical protein